MSSERLNSIVAPAGASTTVLWVDGDALHARAALQMLRQRCPGWHVVHSPSADASSLLLAAQTWDALVLCLEAQIQELPSLLELCAARPVLLCLDPHQEALAARGFRAGLGDYALRAGDGSHLEELVRRLTALVGRKSPSAAHPGEQPMRTVDARIWHEALSLLQEQRQGLQVTLASMRQGIFKTGADGRITIYNQRVLELLDLPESLMAARPTLVDLTQLQSERGDFGPGFTLVDDRGREYVSNAVMWPSPAVYWRTTRDGRTLEVRTTGLPDGGIVRTFTDVSDYVRVQNELRESEARFRSLSDVSSDWYWEHDADGRFIQLAGDLSVNGIPLSSVMGRTRWEIGALNMGEADWDIHRAMLAAQQPFRDLELQRQRPDGSMHWISVSGVPVFDAEGVLRGYRGVGRDISDRKGAELQIERLAFFDALTGLPNRRLLMDRLQRATVSAVRSHAHAALLFIDLDNFKDLNDTLGHDTGDQLLVRVARRLLACVREIDTVARFGGDEFVVLLDGLHADVAHASSEAAAISQQILAALGKPYDMDGINHHSTPSIGIALFGQRPSTAD